MTTPITFELNANDSGAQAAWKRQEAALNAVIEKMSKMEAAAEKTSKKQITGLDALTEKQKKYDKAVQDAIAKQQAAEAKASKARMDAFTQSALGTASAIVGYNGLASAVGSVISANQEMLRQADEAAMKYDSLFRKVNVQAATLGVAGEEGKARLIETAIANASTVDESAGIAKALAGSGFGAVDATGSALDAVLKAQSAMGQQGEGKGAVIAEAVAKYMNSLGIEMTGENMKKVLVGVQQSAKKGFGKFEDMSQLSGKVGGFAGKAESADVLAAFNVGLLNSASADTASTGLKIFGDRLMGAKGDKEREGLLKKVAIKPEDVDFIGENFDKVMERVDKAVQALPVAERAPWMQKFFGTEAAGFSAKLLENRNRMQEFRDVMADEAGFTADVAEMQTGPAAQARRLAVMRERNAAKKAKNIENTLSAADLAADEAGLSPAMRALSGFYARSMVGFGVSPETATKYAYAGRVGVREDGSVGMFGGGVDAEAKRLLAETAAATAAAADGIKKMAARPPVVVEKPAVPKRPAAARAADGR